MEETKVIIRPFDPKTDAALVYSSWRNALWYGNKNNVDSDEFYSNATREIKKIIQRAKVRIACLSDDHDFMVGYAAMTGTRLEFVYVKLDYREKGIGSLLVKGFETIATPTTKIGWAIAKKCGLLNKEKMNVQEETKTAEA